LGGIGKSVAVFEFFGKFLYFGLVERLTVQDSPRFADENSRGFHKRDKVERLVVTKLAVKVTTTSEASTFKI